MAKFIKIRAIEELREKLEYGGGIATGENPIVSAQAEILAALSSGLSTSDVSIHRIVPLNITLFGEADETDFQEIATVFIQDIVPGLFADFISSPHAESSSIRWTPAIRLRQPLSAKEFALWEDELKKLCIGAINQALDNRGNDSYEYSESMRAEKQALDNLELDLSKMQKRLSHLEEQLLQAKIRGTWEELTDAEEKRDACKGQLELEKASLELRTAKFEAFSALMEGLYKLSKLILSFSVTCIIAIGSVHIFVGKSSDANATKPVHVEKMDRADSFNLWTGEVSGMFRAVSKILESQEK